MLTYRAEVDPIWAASTYLMLYLPLRALSAVVSTRMSFSSHPPLQKIILLPENKKLQTYVMFPPTFPEIVCALMSSVFRSCRAVEKINNSFYVPVTYLSLMAINRSTESNSELLSSNTLVPFLYCQQVQSIMKCHSLPFHSLWLTVIYVYYWQRQKKN